MQLQRLSLAVLPLAAAALALGLSLSAQGGGEEPGRREKTPLARAMGELNGAVRAIPRLLKDEAGREPALEQCLRVERLLLDAKLETPPAVAALEDDLERAREQERFRREMNALLAGFLALEDAILADDAAAIDAAMRALAEAKDHGHREFKPSGG